MHSINSRLGAATNADGGDTAVAGMLWASRGREVRINGSDRLAWMVVVLLLGVDKCMGVSQWW